MAFTFIHEGKKSLLHLFLVFLLKKFNILWQFVSHTLAAFLLNIECDVFIEQSFSILGVGAFGGGDISLSGVDF